MNVKDLPAISINEKQSVIFLGNGINRLFNGDSLEALIEKELKESVVDYSYQSIKNMPFSMQIIAASDDNVNKAMERLSRTINYNIGVEQKEFLNRLLDINSVAILTANYSTEIEQALGMENSSYHFFKCQYYSKDQSASMKHYRLHRYSEIGGKNIWHIHGDVYAPNSIVMGNYYYGGLVSKIHQYLSTFMKGYNYCKSRNIDFTPKGWVDYFMIANVYILGFGMEFSESDIWYLISAKKRYFPESKIYFYIPKEELSEKKEIIIMLRAYDVEIVSDISKKPDFLSYYNSAIDDIKLKCANTPKIFA